MKITIITPFFPYPRRGDGHGAERYAENLAIYFKKKGNDVKIVTTFWNGGKRHDLFKGIPILRILESKALFRKFGTIFFLHYITFGLNLFRKKNFNFYKDSDIILINIGMGFTRFFKKRKIPLISIFHHYWFIKSESTRSNFIKSLNYYYLYFFYLFSYYYLEKRQFKRNNNIIAISKSSKNELFKYYGINKKKIKIIPIGIDTNKFNPSNKSKEIRKKYGNNILLYSALTVYRKRLPVLLEAMTQVIKEIPDVRLILTGGGPLWNYCKNLSDSFGLQEHAIFLGFVKEEVLLEFYASSDIYILPSEQEGFGQVILEAMASGTPVICANKPPMSEIVENGGKTFRVNDPEDLSKNIIELLKNREKLLKFKKNALNVAMKYEWTHLINNYIKYFKEILKLKA